MADKLFAVYLGGRAAGCNTELHDVVFAAGENIEATYTQLMDGWFGTVERLHLDSWIELDIVDGHRITLSRHAPNNGMKLYFINLGAYEDEVFGELHANRFLVAGDAETAKERGKSMLSASLPGDVHTDDLHDVDDCIELRRLGAYYIQVTTTTETAKLRPVNGYHRIPKAIIEDYLTGKN